MGRNPILILSFPALPEIKKKWRQEMKTSQRQATARASASGVMFWLEDIHFTYYLSVCRPLMKKCRALPRNCHLFQVQEKKKHHQGNIAEGIMFARLNLFP